MGLFESSLHVLPLDVSVLKASRDTQDASILQTVLLLDVSVIQQTGRIYSPHAKVFTKMKKQKE
jgi:hypothetical protein